MSLDRFQKLSVKEKNKITIHALTTSELMLVINETIFSKEIDRKIAKYKFIKSMSNERVAEKVGYQTNSVQRRISEIEYRLNTTLQRLI